MFFMRRFFPDSPFPMFLYELCKITVPLAVLTLGQEKKMFHLFTTASRSCGCFVHIVYNQQQLFGSSVLLGKEK